MMPLHVPASTFTRRLARMLGATQSTTWKTLRHKLQKRTYHIEVGHKLKEVLVSPKQTMYFDHIEFAENDNLFLQFSSMIKLHSTCVDI